MHPTRRPGNRHPSHPRSRDPLHRLSQQAQQNPCPDRRWSRRRIHQPRPPCASLRAHPRASRAPVTTFSISQNCPVTMAALDVEQSWLIWDILYQYAAVSLVLVLLMQVRSVKYELAPPSCRQESPKMRPLRVTCALLAALVVAACSSAGGSTPKTRAASPASSQSCASAVRSWSDGRGGAAFRTAVGASFKMRAALRSGSRARVSAEAQTMNSAAQRADGHQPPACASGGHYQLAMAYWMNSALDAMDGKLKTTASKLTAGARTIDALPALKRLAPVMLTRLSRHIAIPVVPAHPAPAPSDTSAPPSSTAPTGCYPLSDEGTCYEPGEYCRDSDHGATGIAGDGEKIICEDNDGWRWEPA